jgi:bifunctional DNA-binding transcriptional regulator/antitoxin component of YhaV-PrlF toxin-antitoxin module
MPTSTLTKKGQTTVPLQVREALRVRARQQLHWTIRNDGSVVVRTQPSALPLFGSLPPRTRYPGRQKEREQTVRIVASHAAREGVKG